MVAAWVFTFPGCGLIGFLFASLASAAMIFFARMLHQKTDGVRKEIVKVHKDTQENKNTKTYHKTHKRQLSRKFLLKLVKKCARLSNSCNAR